MLIISYFEALFSNKSGGADDTTAHDPTFVLQTPDGELSEMTEEAWLGASDIEVGQDDLKTLVLLAQEIGHRDLDVVEGDVGGPGCGRV